MYLVGPLLLALYVQLDINIDNIYHLTALLLLNLPRYLPSTSSIWMFTLYVCLYGCLLLVNAEERSLIKYPCCKVLIVFVPHLSYEILLNLRVVGQKCDNWVFAWSIIPLWLRCLCPMLNLQTKSASDFSKGASRFHLEMSCC
jgi:hypothetical protein